MQTTRGASLTPEDPATPASQEARAQSVAPSRAQRPCGRRRVGLLALVAVLGYALDQVTKLLAVERLDGRPPVEVVGDVLRLVLVRNPGAAFGTGSSFTVVLTVVAILAVAVIVVLARRVRDPLWAVAAGLLLAGVTGNLTDRLLRDPGPFRGHVVDFLALPHWPVFNVADMCINLAAALILVQAFRGVRLDGSRTLPRS